MKDKLLENLIRKEINRQQKTINLIASENFVSPQILKILGTPLTNKYSEGYPGKRYYPGNFYYDEIEKLAQKRALKTFNLNPKNWSVNVQPYSGSPANFAIYFALLNTRINADNNADKRGYINGYQRKSTDIMGMALSAGGHLTHGHKVSFSGQLYKAVQYNVDEKTGLLNYQEIERLTKKYRPKIIISGASAYPRKIDFRKFGAIAKKIGAYHLADISHIAGLIAVGLHPSPFPYSDIVMTTTHKTLRGPRAAVIFSRKSRLRQGSRLRRCFGGQVGGQAKLTIAEAIDKAVFPGLQGGPHNNVIAAIAETFFEAHQPVFKKYQKQVVKNAATLAESLKNFGFNLITGGTDNHLMIIDLREQNIDGLTAERKLEKAGILVSRSTLPDNKSPFKPSGMRLGAPAVTSIGMKEKEMRQIAEWIYRILIKNEFPNKIKKETENLCRKLTELKSPRR